MIIRTLHIEGFGKFENETLTFEDGFNLVQGPNEAGKSTVHAFIEAMLYGWLDPAASRRRFLPEHARYEPLSGATYGGSMVLETEAGTYRIERHLEKKDYACRVYNDKTGEDLTDSLPRSASHRIADLGAWLDMPYPLYRSSLSVAQSAHALDESASEDLLRRLQNLAGTKSEALSAENALERLSREAKAIGSAQSRKTPYAEALQRKKALQDELETAQAQHETMLKTLEDLDAAQARCDTLEDARALAQAARASVDNEKKRQLHDAIVSLFEREATLKKERDALSTYATFDKDDLFEALSRHQRLDTLKTEGEDLKQRCAHLQAERDALPKTLPKVPESETLATERKRLLDAQRQILETSTESEETALSEVESRRARLVFDIERTRKRRRLAFALSFLLIPLVYALYLLRRAKTLARTLENEDRHLEALRTTLQEKETRRAEAQRTLEAILERYDVKTPEQFEAMVEDVYTLKAQARRLEETEASLKALAQKRHEIEEATTSEQEALHAILKRYGVEDVEALRAFEQNHDAYRRAEAALRTVQEKREEKEADMPLKTLKETVDFSLAKPDEETRERAETLPDLERERQAATLVLERLKTDLSHQKDRFRDIELIRRDLDKVEADIAAMEARQATIAHAQKRIEAATKRLEETFAPVLSEAVGDTLHAVTASRYDDIRIARDFTFRIVLQSGRLAERAHFSHGTREQVHLAIRFGILKALGLETMPLILDDVFAYTDDERLASTLRIFAEAAPSRQILFFTCHHREATMLKEASIPHHCVALPRD